MSTKCVENMTTVNSENRPDLDLREMRERKREKERKVQDNCDDLLRFDGYSLARRGTYIEPDERRECPEAEECVPHHKHEEKLLILGTYALSDPCVAARLVPSHTDPERPAKHLQGQ